MGKEEDKAIKKSLANAGDEYPDDLKKDVEKLTKDIYEKGMLPKDAMGLSDNMVEGIYSFAYRLYNTGKFDQGIQLFRLLTMLNPTETKYLMGLAACFHMKQEYPTAATTYLLCSMVDPTNPIYQFHASDCYIQSKNMDQALECLENCIASASQNKEKYSVIIDRATASLEALRAKKE